MIETKSLDIDRFEVYLNRITEIIAKYMKGISKEPVVPQADFGNLHKSLDCDIPMENVDIEKLFADIEGTIIPNCTKVGHPRFLAWLLSSPSPAGILGELINVGLGQIPSMFKSAPSATVVEDIVIKWFGELLGYENGFGGILVSGGTMANMTGLAVAREVHFPGAMKKGIHGFKHPPVLYVSDQGHGSVERAAAMLGLGSEAVRRIPTDSKFKMRVDFLNDQIQKDRENGFTPFCVVAQVGSTNTGAVDPLAALGEICKENGLWLHVDAAYGGSAILTEEGQEVLKGLETADSIATDPHKWFFTPVEAGCILVKNRRHLFDTFKTKNANLEDESVTDYVNYGVQFTRASRAFKIWFAFKAYGLKNIAQVVRQNILLARELKARIEKDECWEMVAPVELSAVCFRFKSEEGHPVEDTNSMQMKILRFIEESGEAFFTPAVLNGKVAIRVCFANHRTTCEDLDTIIDLLHKAAEKVAQK